MTTSLAPHSGKRQALINSALARTARWLLLDRVNGVDGCASRRRHLDLVTLGMAQQRTPHRRLIRQLTGRRVRFDGADELIGLLLAALVLDLDGRAEPHDTLAVHLVGRLKNHGVVEQRL